MAKLTQTSSFNTSEVGSSHVSIMIADRGGYFQHFLDFPGRIRGVKNGGTGHHHLSACPDDVRYSARINTAVDLDDTLIISVFNDLPRLSYFPHGIRDEFLTLEARVHCHDEQ